MMRRLNIIIATLALCGSVAFSQSMLDAYKFGQTGLNGTARYMGMGGAFGALGGDISAMNTNPAGLAVYRSSEVVTTLSISNAQAKTNWLGVTDKEGRTRFNFDNIAYVGYFPTGNDAGIIGWNAGFSYNRLKNFNRHYYMRSGTDFHTSLSDYMATRAYGLPHDKIGNANAYRDYGDWTSLLGFQSGIIEHINETDDEYDSVFGTWEGGKWYPYGLDEARMNVRESGAIDQYDIAFGMNISDIVLLGATLKITDISYKLESVYEEWFDVDKNDFYLDNKLATDGSGYGVNLGVIVRPVDFLRLGIAYNSPTWYKMTDSYKGYAGSALTNSEFPNTGVQDASTPDGAYTDYKFRSPDKWLLSAAFILGQYGLISVDYEMTNYRNMRFFDKYGDIDDYLLEKGDIKQNFKMGSTLRIGAEARVTPQFSIRAGGSFSPSPMESDFKKGEIEVFSVGTLPHYTIDQGMESFSVGLGYRFTPQFYMDMACIFTSHKEDAYAFSSIIENGKKLITAQPATLKTNTTQVSLTLGYKF